MKHPAISRIITSIAIAAVILPALSAYSGCHGAHHASQEELAAAEQAGRTRALELTPELNSDTLALENALIDIRERETRLRTHGHDDVADIFIETFLTTLDSVNPALANELN